jgi:hypothetical protein
VLLDLVVTHFPTAIALPKIAASFKQKFGYPHFVTLSSD